MVAYNHKARKGWKHFHLSELQICCDVLHSSKKMLSINNMDKIGIPRGTHSFKNAIENEIAGLIQRPAQMGAKAIGKE